jgi:hypothetical protein
MRCSERFFGGRPAPRLPGGRPGAAPLRFGVAQAAQRCKRDRGSLPLKVADDLLKVDNESMVASVG